MYHALGESASPITTPTAVFAWQMCWLHEHSYQAIPLSRLVRCVRTEDQLPPRSIVITFDDGFASVFTRAYPILAEYGFSATVFLVSDYCGRRNDWPSQPTTVPYQSLMTWTQICEMDRDGIEFGAHSATHPMLDQLAVSDVEREILDSKAKIEDQVGHAIELFAYPYGRYNETVKRVVSRAYTGACSTRLGIVRPGSDPLALDRIEVHCVANLHLFQGLSRPWFSSYLGMRRLLRSAASAILRRPWK
jgi:peptidoglycan/xylan/chitin deacetylase (PgdA/CDA1 family)